MSTCTQPHSPGLFSPGRNRKSAEFESHDPKQSMAVPMPSLVMTLLSSVITVSLARVSVTSSKGKLLLILWPM